MREDDAWFSSFLWMHASCELRVLYLAFCIGQRMAVQVVLLISSNGASRQLRISLSAISFLEGRAGI